MCVAGSDTQRGCLNDTRAYALADTPADRVAIHALNKNENGGFCATPRQILRWAGMLSAHYTRYGARKSNTGTRSGGESHDAETIQSRQTV